MAAKITVRIVSHSSDFLTAFLGNLSKQSINAYEVVTYNARRKLDLVRLRVIPAKVAAVTACALAAVATVEEGPPKPGK